MKIEVTAIIPAYNAERCLARAVRSVLAQTVPCRAIIVNDASSDGTLAVAERYLAEYPKYVSIINNEKNQGVAVSRNHAAEMAETEYIAYLDADDWWSVEKLELQLNRLRESGADACYSGRELMTAEGETTGRVVHVPEGTSYKKLLKGNVIPCSSVLVKRQAALKYPMVHDELHEDYITWLSMLRDGKQFVGIDAPLLKSGLGEDGKSRKKGRSAKMTFGVYRYMGIPVWMACYYFCCYALAGVRKYAGMKNKRK